MNNIKRRNLSGIYIFERFEDEDKKQPTCFEDCTEITQNKWLKSLDKEALVNLVKQLGKILRRLGDEFNITIE